MVAFLQVVAILLAAVGMGLSLAHALELPGKHRLAREDYLKVQTIYYPGFTIGGALGEPGAMLATLLLLVFTPRGTGAFWLTAAALTCLAVEHAIYWLVTHRVRRSDWRTRSSPAPENASSAPAAARPPKAPGPRCASAGNFPTSRAPRLRCSPFSRWHWWRPFGRNSQ